MLMALPSWFLVSMGGGCSHPHYDHLGPLTYGATNFGCHSRFPLCPWCCGNIDKDIFLQILRIDDDMMENNIAQYM